MLEKQIHDTTHNTSRARTRRRSRMTKRRTPPSQVSSRQSKKSRDVRARFIILFVYCFYIVYSFYESTIYTLSITYNYFKRSKVIINIMHPPYKIECI